MRCRIRANSESRLLDQTERIEIGLPAKPASTGGGGGGLGGGVGGVVAEDMEDLRTPDRELGEKFLRLFFLFSFLFSLD